MALPVHTWDNQSLPATLTTTNWGGGTITVGQRFTLAGSRTVYNLLWYKGGAGITPNNLKLWDDSGTLLATITTTALPQNGWNTYALATPVTLSAGTYRVSGYYPGTTDWYFVVEANVVAPPSGITRPASGRCFSSSGDVFPTNTDTSFGPWLFDVALDAVDTALPSSPPPAQTGDVNNALAAWLSSTDGTHADSAPLEDHTLATGTSGFAAIKAVADAINAVVSGLPGTIASALTTITGQLTTMTGNVAQTGLATIGAISHDLASVERQLINGLFGFAPFPGGSSGATWTLAAEADFTQDVAINTPADLYVITFTTLPAGIGDVIVAGVHWHPRLAWAAELNGTHLAFRQFLDFENNQVWAQEHRLQGLLVHGKVGSAGHWQAWQLG